MKKFLFSLQILLLTTTVVVFAQTETDTIWKHNVLTGINFSQTSLSNWAAGGTNSVAGNAYFNGELTYKKGKVVWQNNLALDYGLTKTKETGIRKTSDKFDFASKYGYQATEKLYYSALFDFKTQFAKGYNYPNTNNAISNFFAPAYTTFSLGLDYRPKEYFSVYFSPLALKMTSVLDKELSDKGAFGVVPGKKHKTEFGAYMKSTLKLNVMENVNLFSNLNLFSSYNNHFGNVDIDWDVLVSMKINKYLSATLNTTLKYDDDIDYIDVNGDSKGPKIQFKEVLGIGVAYHF